MQLFIKADMLKKVPEKLKGWIALRPWEMGSFQGAHTTCVRHHRGRGLAPAGGANGLCTW